MGSNETTIAFMVEATIMLTEKEEQEVQKHLDWVIDKLESEGFDRGDAIRVLKKMLDEGGAEADQILAWVYYKMEKEKH